MCPHANGESLTNSDEKDMVLVNDSSQPRTNGKTVNGTNGHVNGAASQQQQVPKNPYAPRYADFLSNVSNFNIIESTLRGQIIFLLAFMRSAD